MTKITFVDKNDHVIGSGTRGEALTKKIIHRIVRIYILNADGQILIQKRSANIDLPDKWDQSAAGHVDEGEDYITAAIRELAEEVGISGVKLTEIARYYSEETDGLVTKKRFNALYTAEYKGEIKPNAEEVSEVKWVSLKTLEKWMDERPEDFTQGFLQSYKYFRSVTTS